VAGLDWRDCVKYILPKEKAKRLHEELKVLDADTLFSIMDAITDFIPIPDDFRREFLAEVAKETPIPLSDLQSLVSEISSDQYIIKQKAIEEFKGLAIPRLSGIEYFCAMRTRFDKEFKYFEDKIEDYDPKVVDHHPVVVVRAETREVDSQSLTFQLDEEGLNKLISELIAAQRELKIVVSALSDSEKE